MKTNYCDDEFSKDAGISTETSYRFWGEAGQRFDLMSPSFRDEAGQDLLR
jgi:hypothetical protein